MTITDEMVEKAASACLGVRDYESYRDCMRSAINAVAPLLIAEGMWKAAQVVEAMIIQPNEKILCLDTLEVCCSTILARAQELDPQ